MIQPMFEDNDSGSINLTSGTKKALLLAVPFVVLGVYFLVAPITELRTVSGAVFGCGSAISVPNDEFITNVCGPLNSMYLYRGIAAIAAGVIIAALGYFLFGSGDANTKNDTESGEKPTDPKSQRNFD